MPKIEPVRCACGNRAKLFGVSIGVPHVQCQSHTVCWSGPERANPVNAVLAWNRVMTAAKEADNG